MRRPRNATAKADTYTRDQQALHWIGALLILAMFPMGFIMARTDSEQLRATLYAAHAVVGILIAVTAVVRLVLARRRPVSVPAGMPRWNQVLHRAVHTLALVVPLILALSGVGSLALNGLMPGIFQPAAIVPAELSERGPQTVHRLVAWFYIGLLVMHIGGVMRYQFTKGDVLSRMGVSGVSRRS